MEYLGEDGIQEEPASDARQDNRSNKTKHNIMVSLWVIWISYDKTLNRGSYKHGFT